MKLKSTLSNLDCDRSALAFRLNLLEEDLQ